MCNYMYKMTALHAFWPARVCIVCVCKCRMFACTRRIFICVDWVHVDRLLSNMCVAQAYYSRRLLWCGWQAVRYECPSLLFLLPSRPAAVCHLVAADDSQPLVCHREGEKAIHQLPHMLHFRVTFRFAFSLFWHKNDKRQRRKERLKTQNSG